MYDDVLGRLKGLHPKVIDLALDRVVRLLAALGDPQETLPPVVHVAGTNGKGSTLAYLRAMVEAAGKSVHVYTSPHLVRFAERIRVAGQIIGDAELTELLAECEQKNAGQPITFFEITTAAAFLAFARRQADLCLLETGLGGRYDATNVVAKPALTLLTPISFDHQAFLGDSLASIAGEKAGILKPGVPCLSARQPAEALAVIAAQASAIGAPLLVEGRDWTVEAVASGIRFAMGGQVQFLPRPNLPGEHQIHNAGLAAAAAQVLQPVLPLSVEAIGAGLRQVEWPARLQRLTKGPLPAMLPPAGELWLDGGHNPSAGQALARFIGEAWHGRPVDVVVGMLNTKDARRFIAPLVRVARSMRMVTIPGEPNALSAEELVDSARADGMPAQASPDVTTAVRDLVQGNNRILICGSLYLAGTILAENS